MKYSQFLVALVWAETEKEAGDIIKENAEHCLTGLESKDIQAHVIINEHDYIRFVMGFESKVTFVDKDEHSLTYPVLDAFARKRGHLNGLEVDESFVEVYLTDMAAERGKTVDQLQFDLKKGVF